MSRRIKAKIEKVRRYLGIVETLKEDCDEKFDVDPLYQGALLHYLYLISDSVVSLAQMLLKKEGIDYAQSYYEAIDLLGEHDIIPKNFAYDFAGIASFRNFLAHDYEKIDYRKICHRVLKKMEQVYDYLDFVEEKIR